MDVEWIVTLIAIAALLVSIWAARTARQSKASAARLASRVVEFEQLLEQARAAEATSAQLVPTLERKFGPAGRVQYRLRIENIGRGTATDVRMRIGGQLLVTGGDGENEPREIDEVPPGMAVSLPVPSGSATVDGSVTVELNWLDAAGRQQTSRAALRGA